MNNDGLRFQAHISIGVLGCFFSSFLLFILPD